MSEWSIEHAWKTCLLELRLPPTQEVAGFWRPLAVSGRAQHSSAAFRLGLTDHLAPNDAVVGGPGFKLEKDAATGPTMKQKVRHILRKRGIGKTAMQSPEAATQAVDEIGECTHAGAHAHCLSMAGGLKVRL